MSSTRLPGKVLLPLCDKTALEHIVDRVYAARNVDSVLVATSVNKTDDSIERKCAMMGVPVFRGSEDNVLERFYCAAKQMKTDVIVRITADDPLKDPEVIEEIIELQKIGKFDYVSNTVHPSFPEGLDCEVFTYEALEKAYLHAELASEKEHVTPYIWKRPEMFRIGEIKAPANLSELRWTMDCPEDYEFMKEIYQNLYVPGEIFYMRDILKFLELHPEIGRINEGHIRNEGYLKSIQQERSL